MQGPRASTEPRKDTMCDPVYMLILPDLIEVPGTLTRIARNV
jgi:hypothetical protein